MHPEKNNGDILFQIYKSSFHLFMMVVIQHKILNHKLAIKKSINFMRYCAFVILSSVLLKKSKSVLLSRKIIFLNNELVALVSILFQNHKS